MAFTSTFIIFLNMFRQVFSKLKIFTLLILFSYLPVVSQNYSIEKVIVDAETLSPIENVNIFNDTATTEIYTTPDTLSLHDALPISHVGT